MIDRVRVADQAMGREQLTRTVAHTLSKLMAYKDEYEVARLYSDDKFLGQLNEAFEGDFTIRFNLAPPLLAGRDADGRPRKMTFGPWMLKGFRLLSGLRGLRGTVVDPFGYLAHRRLERALIGEYEALIGELLSGLDASRYDQAVDLAAVYGRARGYDRVKEHNIEMLRGERDAMLDAYRIARRPSPELQPALAD